MMRTQAFRRLIRFSPRSTPKRILIGHVEDNEVDVGIAIRQGRDVQVQVLSGKSMLEPGEETGETAVVERILSPLAEQEVGAIRCIGLNYKQHAAEVGLAIPKVPTVFLKPSTALASPYPEPTVLPKITQIDNCADYEAELAVVLGRTAKNVSEKDAMAYVLGYTAANDVSSRSSQFEQSQWCFSKGFDGSCPIGPVLVTPALIPDPGRLRIRGLKNGQVLQDCGTDDLIFTVGKLISFLSQGTTLPAGTVIITGTPAGVGVSRKPPVSLNAGDEFSVEISPYIGTLVNKFENE